MTIVGYGLAGMAIAVGLAPRRLGVKRWSAILATAVVAANLPDAPLPYWGFNRYNVSHSVFVAAAILLALTAVLLLWPRGTLEFRGRLAALIAAAWLSHLVLDCCDTQGRGLAMFWPFTHARLALPMPWFGNLPDGWTWDRRALHIIARDVEFFGPVLLLAVSGRWIGWRRRVRAQAQARAQRPACPV